MNATLKSVVAKSEATCRKLLEVLKSLPSPVVAVVEVGHVYWTDSGNLWLVIELLDNDRVRVERVGNGETCVWHVSSLTSTTAVRIDPGQRFAEDRLRVRDVIVSRTF
jgi:hypothetical protein